MRSRYFLTILSVLSVVSVASITIHGLFLKSERLALIDQQVRETAEALVDSELGDLRTIDFAESEKIIAQELGESRIGKFFIIRNAKDEKIFENDVAKQIDLKEFSRKQQWVTIQTKENYIRVLNLQLPKFPDRFLQVGIVVDNDFVSPNYLSKSTLAFLGVILVIGLAASLFLTSFLLKPLAWLEGFLTQMSDQVKIRPQLDMVPDSVVGSATSKDEFKRMVGGLNALIDKVNSNYRFSRLWAYQMAHELKTPLSVLRLELEKIQEKTGLSDKELLPVVTENNKISDTIGSFLGWAELENSKSLKYLFVNRLGTVAGSVAQRLTYSHPNRVELNIDSDPTVVASPQHLEQLVSNLLVNALTYSTSTVALNVHNRALTIIDKGPGIPEEVLSRLGEPFNRGEPRNGSEGNGLGLAWVKSICRLYSWEVGIFPSSAGTKIVVVFPANQEFSQDEAQS